MPMTRRRFLKGATSTAATGLVPISLSIPVSSAFANEQGGYKALVCLFLHGGNDSFNMIVPTDSDNYAKYQTARPDIHLTSSEILAIPNSESAQGIGINGSMPNIANLLNLGQAAAVVNVGTLVEPTNKNNLYDVKKPPNLGAHNKQQAAWQSSWGDGSYHSYGWAGMMMDVIGNESAIVSDSMSFAGNELLSGARSKDISISSDGVRAMDALGHSGAVNNNFTKLVNAPYGSVFKQEYIARLTGILDFQQELEQLLTTYPEDTSIPDSSLGLQFRMVRRMIQSASELGHSRQVFFVNLGGFDNHSNQRGRQDGLFATIDQAVSAFHASLAELGLEDSVITSTMSDFGRTIENNSKAGTDHGWGSNQLVVGHAVNGGKSYGSMPDFVKDGQDGYGNKFIPSQSSEQLAATLCRWMGLSEQGIDVVFPSLSPNNTNPFPSRYLGVLGGFEQEPQEMELPITSVSATAMGVDKLPEMAIDGDPNTAWTGKGRNVQFLIELAVPATITKLLYSQGNGDIRQFTFDIETSLDGVNFEIATSVTSPGNTTGVVEQVIGNKAAQFVRLVCKGSNTSKWNNFQELRLLGY